jgi:hypothetical protein
MIWDRNFGGSIPANPPSLALVIPFQHTLRTCGSTSERHESACPQAATVRTSGTPREVTSRGSASFRCVGYHTTNCFDKDHFRHLFEHVTKRPPSSGGTGTSTFARMTTFLLQLRKGVASSQREITTLAALMRQLLPDSSLNCFSQA